MNQTIEAMNDFKIVNRPSKTRAGHDKYNKLLPCLKNLANDKAVEVRMEDYGFSKLPPFRASIQRAAKHAGLQASACEQHGAVYVFTK